MKQTTHENIKQMDIALGGGIFGEKARIDTINHPVLVIGLGGTGTDALLRLKYQINRRFKLGENPVTKQKKPKPDNIEYISFETNEHDRKKYKGISLDPYTETVLLSNAGIGAILNNRSTLPDYISKWLNPALTITDGTKGASGNRQSGRLLLFEKINTAIDAIDNKIKTLRTDQENKLLVYILSGLSGGTGGGMFLDVAYIVRGLMEREFGGKGIDKVEITGYLFTPDVHLAGNNLNIHTQEYIQRNGYAALKELDYFMNIEERGERFSQQYGTRLEVNCALAPFNLCHLVSACNIDGVFLKGAYDYCMNVTAENIVNFLALEDKESGNEFAIQDYNSNLISNIGTMKSNLPQGMSHSANFVYNIIGASAAVLPTEGINSQLAHSLFNELSPLFEAEPDDHELQQFAQSAGLEINTLGAELSRNFPPIKLDYAETDYYSYQNVIKTRRVNVDEKLAEQYAAAKRELSNGASREITAAAIENVKRELREVFLNHKQGPLYATRLISSTTNPCLLARLDAYGKHVSEKISALSEEIDALEISAETRLEEARKAFFLTRESKKNAYIETAIRTFQTRLQRDIFTRLVEIYKEIRAEIEAENDRVYSAYDKILREIRKILQANDSLLRDGIQNENAKSYHWDVIAVKDTAAEIESNLREIGFETLARDFAKFLLENSAKWLSDAELDINGSFSDYICDKFEILTRSMPEFLGFRYGKEKLTEFITESEIAPRLYRDAKPIFHLDNAAGIFNFPSYGVVSVPANAPEILRGIEAYQDHALANLRFNIRKSSITDRIFWLNTQNGIPLFAYTPIRVYEELYERTINTKEGIGRHLVMNENENWTNLPSPLPEKLWGDTYTNPRQKVLNDEAREIFRQLSGVGDLPAMLEEDFFIRCPQLIAKTRHELSNRTVTSETEKETDLTDEFLRVLVCEAIVKRGALYLFEKELEDDPWPPFANLMDNADFPEFTMFSRYKTLDTTRQTTLRKKAKNHERLWPEDKLIINLKKWQGKIAVRKNQLDNEMWKWQNGKDMYTFYRNALLRLNTQISALAG
ncbi:MAG: tubulin-like doman-containing protein [Defluviitaleaceae bacterium]|nr:tubulin-like doman-containing protein [Defluviitaleaceae bacterium]MCL2263559.1 tubulin-like doman-containing protein [Defluviitaleaceae bacterium]